MKIVIPHVAHMAQHSSLAAAAAEAADLHEAPETDQKIWVNGQLTAEEQSNLLLIKYFWDAWKEVPFDIEKLARFFSPDLTVRTGWRGEHVIHGREHALSIFASEVERQNKCGETADYRFPIIVARGPLVFLSYVWIASSKQLDYHIERPMAACYLITDGVIERWDNYCTGRESQPGYSGGQGPDGL